MQLEYDETPENIIDLTAETTPVPAKNPEKETKTPLDHEIFDMPQWQSDSDRPLTLTPQDVKNALMINATTITPWETILKTLNISMITVQRLALVHPELAAAYEYTRKLKAGRYSEDAVNTYQQIPPDAYETDKNGQKRLSQAYVTYMRDKIAVWHRQAALHDRETYGDKQTIERRSLEVRLNYSPEDVQQHAQNLERLINPSAEQG